MDMGGTCFRVALCIGCEKPRVCALIYTRSAGAVEAAGQAADMDLQPSLSLSAKHRISGVAVTWDAEHLFFLPASAGVPGGPLSKHEIFCTLPFAGSPPVS